MRHMPEKETKFCRITGSNLYRRSADTAPPGDLMVGGHASKLVRASLTFVRNALGSPRMPPRQEPPWRAEASEVRGRLITDR
jgi:hypothetical protein